MPVPVPEPVLPVATPCQRIKETLNISLQTPPVRLTDKLTMDRDIDREVQDILVRERRRRCYERVGNGLLLVLVAALMGMCGILLVFFIKHHV